MSRDIDPREIPSSGLAYVGEVGLVSPLVHLLGSFRGEDRSNVHGRDNDAEISWEKAATTALNALQQLS